jgi:hypothetical protein
LVVVVVVLEQQHAAATVAIQYLVQLLQMVVVVAVAVEAVKPQVLTAAQAAVAHHFQVQTRAVRLVQGKDLLALAVAHHLVIQAVVAALQPHQVAAVLVQAVQVVREQHHQ